MNKTLVSLFSFAVLLSSTAQASINPNPPAPVPDSGLNVWYFGAAVAALFVASAVFGHGRNRVRVTG